MRFHCGNRGDAVALSGICATFSRCSLGLVERHVCIVAVNVARVIINCSSVLLNLLRANSDCQCSAQHNQQLREASKEVALESPLQD